MTMNATSRPLALVTGASAGIGAEFARQLAARGYDLILTARRRERLEAIAADLAESYGAACRIIVADLSLSTAPAVIAREATADGREVELLVNNAGYAVTGRFQDAPWEDHHDFLQVMVAAVAELSHRLLPPMQARGRGTIINVASLAGIVPGSAGHTLYAAAKAFVIKFSESLAMENADTGVRVQAFCPGFTYSEFHDVAGTRQQVSKMPEWMWMQADRAVALSLEALDRPASPVMLVPGRVNRFLAMLARKLPYRASFRMVQRRSGDFRNLD